MPAEPVQPLHDPAGPARAVDDDAPLFSWLQIAAAALCGTPITAGVFWAANVRALGRARPWAGVVVGAVATLVPFAVATWVRSELFVLLVLLSWPVGAGIAAGKAFGWFEGKRQRSNVAVVVGVVGVMLVLIKVESVLHVRGAVVPVPDNLPASVTAGGVSVQYVDGVNVDDAERTARFLDQAGFAKEAGRLSVRLGRDHEGFKARLRVPAPVNAEVLESGKRVGRALAAALEQCVTTSLVRAEDDRQLASGRSCPQP